jgi:hypothetical protein
VILLSHGLGILVTEHGPNCGHRRQGALSHEVRQDPVRQSILGHELA